MDVVDSARRAFLNNQIEAATAALDAVLSQQASHSEETLFDARCIRSTIAALVGTKDDPFLTSNRAKTRSDLHIKLYVEATAALRSGRSLKAVLNLQSILREDPHFVAARMGLAAAHMAQQQWNEAFQQYSEVLATTGTSAPAIVRVGLAICSMRREQFEHAKKCLNRALEIEPNDDLACMAMIVLQLQQRDGPGAAETIKRLYGLAPENPIIVQKFADLVFFKGVSTGRLADIAHAIRDLIGQAVKLDTAATALTDADPTKEVRHRLAYSKFQLGRLAHYEGRFEEACGLYKEATSVLGTQLKAAFLYATKALYQLGRPSEAVRYLERLEEENQADKDVLQMMVAHHEMSGNDVKAMYYAQKLTDEYGIGDPKSYWARAFTARHNTHSALKNITIAKAIPNQTVPEKAIHTEGFLRAQQPSTAAAALGEMLSNLQAAKKETDEVKLLEPSAVVESLIANPDLLPHYYNIATAMLTSSSAPLRAVSSGSSASSSSATDANAGKRLQTAQKVLTAIIKTFPTFMDPYYRLAELYIAHKQFSSALKWLALAMHVRPNDGYCLTMLAKLYYDNKNSRVAVETLRRAMAATTGGKSADGDAAASAEKDANALVPSLAMGSLLLWSAQQPSDKAAKHLLGAKECFSRPLRADPGNALAAYGLAATVGLGGGVVSRDAKAEQTENCIAAVQSAVLNDPSSQVHCELNLVNCMTKTHSYKRVIDQLSGRLDKIDAAQIGTLGFCLAADGQLQAATEAIQKGLERFPNSQPLRYNRIIVLYSRITKELGTTKLITEEEGRNIRNLIVLASDLSHEFVSEKHTGSEMSLSSFNDAQRNVKSMAKQLIRLEECLQAAVRKAVIDEKVIAKKSEEWRLQAAQAAALEEQRRAEAAAAAEEKARLEAEKSRLRYDAMLDFTNRGVGGGDADENLLAMGRAGAVGYAGEVMGFEAEAQPEMTAEEMAEAITGEALAV